MDNDFEYGQTVIIFIVCIFICIFSVATAINQQHKQYSILSASHQQLPVSKRYKSTSHMTTVIGVILMLPFCLALCKSSLLLIFPCTKCHVRMGSYYFIEHCIALYSIHVYYSTQMILVPSFYDNGILFTFENVAIYMLYRFLHVARVNGKPPTNSLIPNCCTCTCAIYMFTHNDYAHTWYNYNIQLEYRPTYYDCIKLYQHCVYLNFNYTCKLKLFIEQHRLTIYIIYSFPQTLIKGCEQICICEIACTSLLCILYCRNHRIHVCQINVPQHYVSTISKYIIPWCINISLSLQTTRECSTKTLSIEKRMVLQDILRYHCGIKIITFNDDIIIVLLIVVLGILPYSDVTCLSHSSPCSPCPVCYDNLSSNLIIYDGS